MTATSTMMDTNMVEQLSEKMHITQEEARAALEAGDWNMLTATHLLEQEAFNRMQALNEIAGEAQATAEEAETENVEAQTMRENKTASGLKKTGRAIMDLIVRGNRTRFTVLKGDMQLLEMPVTALALLLMFSFGTCALLMLIGLFTGCRYDVREKGAAVQA